jgi:hypothetical protein
MRTPEVQSKSRPPQDPLLIAYEKFSLFEHVRTYFNDNDTTEVKTVMQRQQKVKSFCNDMLVREAKCKSNASVLKHQQNSRGLNEIHVISTKHTW